MKAYFTSSSLLLFFITPLYAGWFGPSNYDECILENVKPGLSSAALATIKQSCKNKFKKKGATGYEQLIKEVDAQLKRERSCNKRYLTQHELGKLKLNIYEGAASIWNGGEISFSHPTIEFWFKGQNEPVILPISDGMDIQDIMYGFYFPPGEARPVKGVPKTPIKYRFKSAITCRYGKTFDDTND